MTLWPLTLFSFASICISLSHLGSGKKLNEGKIMTDWLAHWLANWGDSETSSRCQGWWKWGPGPEPTRVSICLSGCLSEYKSKWASNWTALQNTLTKINLKELKKRQTIALTYMSFVGNIFYSLQFIWNEFNYFSVWLKCFCHNAKMMKSTTGLPWYGHRVAARCIQFPASSSHRATQIHTHMQIQMQLQIGATCVSVFGLACIPPPYGSASTENFWRGVMCENFPRRKSGGKRRVAEQFPRGRGSFSCCLSGTCAELGGWNVAVSWGNLNWFRALATRDAR